MNSTVIQELIAQLKKDGSLAFIVMLVAITQFISAITAPADTCGGKQLDMRLVGFWGFVIFVSGILCLSQRIKEGRHARLQKTLEGLKAQVSEYESELGSSTLRALNLDIGALSRKVSQKQHPARVTIAMLWAGALFIGIGLITACLSSVSLTMTAAPVGTGVLVISGAFLTAAFLPEPVLEEVNVAVSRLRELAEKLDALALEQGKAVVEKVLSYEVNLKKSCLILSDMHRASEKDALQ